ncbi:MAG TPA: ATP synthase F0 subunit B [Terriglobales bacterium]|nr:ATP synthase F0 subunit B [Terriglobales bacterium]
MKPIPVTLRQLCCLPVLACLVMLLGVLGSAAAQEARSSPSGQNSASQSGEPAQNSAKDQEQRTRKEERARSMGAQLAEESREAAGEGDENAAFRQSGSIKWLARHTGLSLNSAYWLAVLLNFGVVTAGIIWASKKFLPGMFRDRTVSIQRAMEEARTASADANRRLSEIEARLSRLGDEIQAMRHASEQEARAEEERMREAAEDDKRKIIESAEQEITAAAKQARRELTSYAADLAVSLAKKQIHVDASTDQQLVRSFADQLPNGNGQKGRR